MGWHWHQLDHMQIICTLFQTDNHASTSPVSFYRPDALPAAQPTASKHWRHCYAIKMEKIKMHIGLIFLVLAYPGCPWKEAVKRCLYVYWRYAVAMSLRDKQRVIYTTPIKALSNQKYRELFEAFQDVGLMTGDVTINPTASALVMTTEVRVSILLLISQMSSGMCRWRYVSVADWLALCGGHGRHTLSIEKQTWI